MKPENIEFLEANRYFKEAYSMEQIPRHMTIKDREKLEQIIRDEFEPGYTCDQWCEGCVREMVLKAYEYYDSRK